MKGREEERGLTEGEITKERLLHTIAKGNPEDSSKILCLVQCLKRDEI